MRSNICCINKVKKWAQAKDLGFVGLGLDTVFAVAFASGARHFSIFDSLFHNLLLISSSHFTHGLYVPPSTQSHLPFLSQTKCPSHGDPFAKSARRNWASHPCHLRRRLLLSTLNKSNGELRLFDTMVQCQPPRKSAGLGTLLLPAPHSVGLRATVDRRLGVSKFK